MTSIMITYIKYDQLRHFEMINELFCFVSCVQFFFVFCILYLFDVILFLYNICRSVNKIFCIKNDLNDQTRKLLTVFESYKSKKIRK